MNNCEIWKNIRGFENIYQLSSFGNVRKIQTDYKGNVVYKIRKIGKFIRNNNAYASIRLYKNGKVSMYSVHRLVAESFIESPYCCPHVEQNMKLIIKTEMG